MAVTTFYGSIVGLELPMKIASANERRFWYDLAAIRAGAMFPKTPSNCMTASKMLETSAALWPRVVFKSL